MRSLPILLASLLTVAFAGCAGLFGVPPAESKAAIKNKDYARLKDMCTGKIKIASNIANHQSDTCRAAIQIAHEQRDAAFLQPLCGRRNESFGARYAGACPAMLDLAVQANDAAAIGYLCDHDKYDEACRARGRSTAFGDLANPDCGQLRATFDEARKTFLKTDRAKPEEFGPVVAALAKCGEDELIFEGLAHIGKDGAGGFGTKLLVATEEAGGPALFAAFERYLAAHAGKRLLAAEHGDFAGNHISEWLLASKRTELCEPLVRAATGAQEDAITGLTRYFMATDCTAAAPLVVAMLSSQKASVRTFGCTALGKLGGRVQLAKVQIVAETDRTSRLVEGPYNSGVFVKEYFVADACSKAIGEIQLRE